MSKEELKQTMQNAEKQIHEEIRKLYPNSAGLDGIISIDDYLDINNPESNPLKSLWVLKERGYPSNKINQEFVISEYMKGLGQYSRWRDTYGPMCYVTEGLLEWQRTKNDKFLNFKNLFVIVDRNSFKGGIPYVCSSGSRRRRNNDDRHDRGSFRCNVFCNDQTSEQRT